jgi:uncharacterized membrane protein
MSVNPFDIRTVVQAKHAQHVVLIHFPIALFIAGVAFDFIAQWTKRAAYAAAAYFNFTFAALSTIPVVITGILAWQWALEGQRVKGILLQHLVLGGVSSALLWIVFWLHYRARQKPDVAISGVRIALELFGVLLVSLTGHLGGFLSGVNLPS